MKDILLVISLLMAVGLLVVVVRFAQKVDKAGKSLEEERYSRMVAEETLQKNDAKLSTLSEELQEDQDKMAKIEDILNQEKGLNVSLKQQYDEMIQTKVELEAKLQKVIQEKAAIISQAQSQAHQAPPALAVPTGAQSAQPAGASANSGH